MPLPSGNVLTVKIFARSPTAKFCNALKPAPKGKSAREMPPATVNPTWEKSKLPACTGLLFSSRQGMSETLKKTSPTPRLRPPAMIEP